MRFDGTRSRQDGGQYTFADTSGKPILLKSGHTWLHGVAMELVV